MTEPVLHVTTATAWAAAQREGVYRTPTLDGEGFIHFSTPAQVAEVADFLYRGRTDLVLLCVNPDRLAAELRYEALTTDEPFPHLYGPLNADAVVRVVPFPPLPDGTFRLPAGAEPLEPRGVRTEVDRGR